MSLVFPPSPAIAAPPKWVATCKTALGTVASKAKTFVFPPRMPFADYKVLFEKPLKDYFGKKMTTDAGKLQKLYADIDLLFDNMKQQMTLKDFKAFRKWWETNRDRLLLSEWETLKRENPSIGRIALAAHMQYLTNKNAPKLSLSLKTLPMLALNTGKTLLSWGFSFLKSLIFFGPMVAIANSYLSSVTNPLQQTAGQRGAKDLSIAAEWIQAILSNPEEMEKAKKDLEKSQLAMRNMGDLLDSLERLEPEQASARWMILQKSFFDYYQNFNKTLPAHLRDGRFYVRNEVLNQISSYSAAITNHDTNYEVHKTRFDALGKLARERELTADEKTEMKRHRDHMDAEQKAIATTLATWRLNEIMFPEYFGAEKSDSTQTPLQHLSRVFTTNNHFGLFQQEFNKQMRERLIQVGVTTGKFEGQLQAADKK